jgi:DNA-binding transcriptional LysR family regulator
MDRLESMKTLVAAVDARSLSAASRKLGMPIATVSRKVSELEAHLQTQLVVRSSRRLTLTDAGRLYLESCRSILEQIGEAERAASGEYSAPRGDLTITAPIVFGRLHVLPIIADFMQSYPDIDIRLLQADRVVNLLEEHVDVAIRIGELPDSSLIARRIGSIRRVVCGSPSYFVRRGTLESPGDLKAHDCITFAGLSSPGAWTFRKGKSEIAVPVHSRLVVNTAEAAIDAALSDAGLTRVLCYQIAGARRSRSLEIALEEFEPAPWPLSMIYSGQTRLPLKLRAFLDFATPRLTSRLAESPA